MLQYTSAKADSPNKTPEGTPYQPPSIVPSFSMNRMHPSLPRVSGPDVVL
jgi:hypothetical protein